MNGYVARVAATHVIDRPLRALALAALAAAAGFGGVLLATGPADARGGNIQAERRLVAGERTQFERSGPARAYLECLRAQKATQPTETWRGVAPSCQTEADAAILHNGALLAMSEQETRLLLPGARPIFQRRAAAHLEATAAN